MPTGFPIASRLYMPFIPFPFPPFPPQSPFPPVAASHGGVPEFADGAAPLTVLTSPPPSLFALISFSFSSSSLALFSSCASLSASLSSSAASTKCTSSARADLLPQYTPFSFRSFSSLASVMSTVSCPATLVLSLLIVLVSVAIKSLILPFRL